MRKYPMQGERFYLCISDSIGLFNSLHYCKNKDIIRNVLYLQNKMYWRSYLSKSGRSLEETRSTCFLWGWNKSQQLLLSLTQKFININKRKIKVCLCNTSDSPGGNKVQKAKFSFKVKVNVTRSLTVVSFERVSLVDYACQIWSLYLLRFKNYSEG